MAGRGRRRAQEVAIRHPGGSIHSRLFERCHSSVLARVGIFLLSGALAVACEGVTQRHPRPSNVELRVGFAGANLSGADFGIGQFATLLTFEGLTRPGLDGRPTPRLAEGWQWENDGLRLRVTLRSGVVFHDGTPLTAAVGAEILRVAVQRPANLAQYPSFSDIESITPDGDHQLVIDLARRSAFLPEELSIPITRGTPALGTGPYVPARRQEEGGDLVMERFDAYYRGRPSISRVVVKPFEALRTAWSSLLRGDVDMVSDVPPDAAEFVRSNDVQVLSFARGYQYIVAFNSRQAPFSSAAVRRALNIAVNRDELIKVRLQGAALAATGPLWPKHWAYDSAIRPFPFDPKLSATMLDDAGFRLRPQADSDKPPARLRFTCLVPSGFAVLERIALDVQKQLYDVGVDMQFQVLSMLDFNTRIQKGDFEAMLTDIISGPSLGRPFIFWRSSKESKGLNVFGYENADAERLFQLLRTETNEAAIRSTTRRLQQVFLEDPPALFLAWSERTRAVRRYFDTGEAEQDPLYTVWRWTADNPNGQARAALDQ